MVGCFGKQNLKLHRPLAWPAVLFLNEMEGRAQCDVQDPKYKTTEGSEAPHTYIPLQNGSGQDRAGAHDAVPTDGEAPLGVRLNKHDVWGFSLQVLDCCLLVELIV